MGKYRDFKEYMEDIFYDEIFNRLKPFIAGQKDSFESDEIYKVKWVEVDDIHVSGVTFKEREDGFLEIRTSIDADVDVEGKARYGYDHFAVTKTYNVFFQALLENGLQQVKITKVEEYNPNTYERDRSLSQNLVPYMYEEDVEKHAEDCAVGRMCDFCGSWTDSADKEKKSLQGGSGYHCPGSLLCCCDTVILHF